MRSRDPVARYYRGRLKSRTVHPAVWTVSSPFHRVYTHVNFISVEDTQARGKNRGSALLRRGEASILSTARLITARREEKKKDGNKAKHDDWNPIAGGAAIIFKNRDDEVGTRNARARARET